MPSEDMAFQAWEEENKRAEDEYYSSLPQGEDSENDEILGTELTKNTKIYNTTFKDDFDDIQSSLNPFPDDEIGVTSEDPVHTVQRQIQ